MLNVVGKRKIFYTFSLALIGAGIFSLIFWGLHFGLDFNGGSLMEIEWKAEAPANAVIKDNFSKLEMGEVFLQSTGEKGLMLRFKDVDEAGYQKVFDSLKKAGELEEKRFDSVGPVIGQELKNRAYSAILLVLVLIVLYIAFAFRKVSRPIASWKYGLAAVIALFHDIFIPAGIFSILGHFKGVEIDLLFVTGLLTILGFSVHDTIVVFDRIRENLRRGTGNGFEDTVNLSINQTITRSINTSLTVFFTLLAIFIFGGESTKYFALLLMIGIFFGTYSSIFVASSLLVSWEKFRQKRISRKLGR